MPRTLRYALVLLAALAGGRLSAQWKEQRVVVLDSLDDRPIAEVVLLSEGRTLAITDREGRARIIAEQGISLAVRFRHVAYGERVLAFPPERLLPDGTWVVRLLPLNILLGTVGIERPKPETVFLRKDLHAADLLINADGLWVLAYEHPRLLRAEGDARKEILRDVRLVLLDTLYTEVASCPVPEDVFGLRHDLRNDVVIEGTRHAFGVARQGTGIVLRPFGLEELRRAVLPWTDSIPGWVVGSNGDDVYPALDHLAYAPPQDSTALICSVVDTFMMALFRSEYKYLKGPEKVVAMDLAAELGIDKEVVAGYMSGFQHNIWFKPIYAPLFVVGDTLLVFDHARGRLRKFTRGFTAAGDAPLGYLVKGERRDWAERIVQDRETQALYAQYARYGATWLRRVDPRTGALGDRFRITSEYPERVQVHGGYVYYIARPYASLQKRTIYRERLR
ncbi:MAG: hypothetical protein JST66_02605 [Bacteroidetes bacterium]|nr:hypothetical protein [Bacteroidota bacterium]